MFMSRRSRYLLMQIVIFVALSVAVVRLFLVQIVEHRKYVDAASEIRISKYSLLAKRGEVYMMDGKNATTPVIMNERTWLVFVDPSYVEDKDKVQAQLTNILGNQMITTWDKVWQDMTKGYVEVAKHVNYETITKVKEANLRGVGQKETSRRVYPAGKLGSQLLGFINAEGTGTGLEGSLNDRLSGKNGMLKTITDVNQIPLSIGDDNIEIPAEDGENIVLTVDENIQRKIEKILKTRMEKNRAITAASAIVMDPNTGKIMAMANYPTYNPEKYYKVKDAKVFINRVAESPYEPASVCKTFTYAAAINEGVLSPTDTYYNRGYTYVEDRKMQNALTNTALGTITFRTALDYSFNTGSIEALRRLGGGSITKAARTKLYNYLTNNFGLGKRTGIEIYDAPGIIISPEEDEGNAVRYANMTFGQGMDLTMLQVAAAFSSLVNGGKYYEPTIVAGQMKNGAFYKDEDKMAIRQTISENTSTQMRSMLEEVRSKEVPRSGDKAGYKIGIKTGTSETYDASGKYTSDATIASVIGYGRTNKSGSLPEYVVMIRLDGSSLLWGSLDAVPVFTEISNYLLEYLRIEPIK
ncbi:penicillin-binding protein 2 [Candidatus Saccharibacteria bacterium]|nr:penicillin-binding protein 2 [Candidatus Saccharibacteria bacterium]